VLVANRDGGLFQLIEVWVENQFMLEVMTPEQTARYVEIANPEFIAQFFGAPPDASIVSNQPAENLNVIG
jgi:hypothetical protein